MSLDSVLAKFPSARRSGNGWKALCPAHPDRNPSLSVREENGRVLLKCFRECTLEAICAAAGIEMRELFTQNADTGHKGRKRKMVATYDYTNENSNVLYQVVRFEPKDFRQRRPNGKGSWTWKLGNVRHVLYRLPEVLAASDVFIVEGEKDADTGNTLGLTVTTSGAVGTWRDEFSETLRGKRVTIIADADVAGRKHAEQVAASLSGKVESLKMLGLPGAKDLTEWVEKGGTREQFLALVNTMPEWKPEIVDGAQLLDRVMAYVRRFVSLSESQARIVAVWSAHTHAFDAADSTPYLAITSAEKQSGKTRLLEVLETVVANPWFTGKVTAAVLYRNIDADNPTLLLDESDAAFAGEKEYAQALRGVLDTGHRRGGKASCLVGKGAEWTCKNFSTYCSKAIAGIGKLPDTVGDRAIPIRLKRAARGEKIERFRHRDIETEAAHLKTQIEAWCQAALPRLRDARPKLPEELTDRQQDGAEPLLAIADAAGGDWPEALRQSLVALCAEAQTADSSIGEQLLTDIRGIFDVSVVDRLTSADLAAALCEIETSPWAEWVYGKPITQGKLARLLAPHEIKPHTIRFGDKTPKGYLREDFSDAWARYLPTRTPSSAFPLAESATAATSFVSSDLEQKHNATQDTYVADQKPQKPALDGPCGGVAVSWAETEGKRVVEGEV